MKKLTKLTTILERIVAYQIRNRQVGHTSLMIDGIAYCTEKKAPLYVVGNTHQKEWMAQQLQSRLGCDRSYAKSLVLTTHEIENGVLDKITGRPLVVDNIGLFMLAMDVSDKRKELLLEKFREDEKGKETNDQL
jgi:hypothetical protein